jgi:hypothetical protein
VEVEPLEPLQLKGKSQPVIAYRSVQAHGDVRSGSGIEKGRRLQCRKTHRRMAVLLIRPRKGCGRG